MCSSGPSSRARWPRDRRSAWLRAAVLVEPVEERADAPGRERDAGVRGAVVEPERVAVRVDRVAAREGDVADVPGALVGRLGTEDPLVAAQQAMLGAIEREEREPEPIEAARRR